VLGKVTVDRGVRLALSGAMGDTLFGSLHGFAALARRGQVLRAIVKAARLSVPWETTPLGLVRDTVLTPSVRHRIPAWGVRIRRRLRRQRTYPWLSTDALRFLPPEDPRLRAAVPDTPEQAMATLWMWSRLADYADSCGQFTAATSCICTDVLYDPRLVEFMTRIDPAIVNHGDQYRGLYRLAMKGVLPEAVRTRRDKAFFEPAVAMAARAGDGLDALGDLASVRGLASLGLVDPVRFRPHADTFIAAVAKGMTDHADHGAHWERFWRTLAVERFVRLWGGSRPPPEGPSC
jgi:hypothetical protein